MKKVPIKRARVVLTTCQILSSFLPSLAKKYEAPDIYFWWEEKTHKS